MVIVFSFLITAILYAAVGFGGGSTYNALLVLAKTDYHILPAIALSCNLIVVSSGCLYFAKAGHINIKRLLPWFITSIPAAFIGGMIPISEVFFVGLLGMVLFISGLRMLLSTKKYRDDNISIVNRKPYIAPIVGSILGLLAGIVGIGGGIFLAPVLHLLHWGKAKEIAGACSVFIFLNSLAGLAGQIIKLENIYMLGDILQYWYLFPAVFIGGQLGSWLGSKKLKPRAISIMTAVLILYVSVRLIIKFFNMINL